MPRHTDCMTFLELAHRILVDSPIVALRHEAVRNQGERYLDVILVGTVVVLLLLLLLLFFGGRVGGMNAFSSFSL